MSNIPWVYRDMFPYYKNGIEKWRIYADEDFMYNKDISIYPIVYPTVSGTVLNVISKLRNKYVFYYVFLF